MKNKYIVIYVLTILPIIITLISLFLLPDQVPLHYNIEGEVDRIGSKYELILLPIITTTLGAVFTKISRLETKKKDHGNEKVLVISAMTILGLFNAIIGFLLYQTYSYPSKMQGQSDHEVGFQFILIVLGIAICILGNYMPKTRMNSLIGVRTTWSMKNETVWMKSQRFGGISFVITGVIVVIANLFITSYWSLIVSIGLLIGAGISSTIATYIFYKKY